MTRPVRTPGRPCRLASSLALAALLEAGTGMALFAAPALVGQLGLGAEFTGVAVVAARVTGIPLLALAYACWPGPPSAGA